MEKILLSGTKIKGEKAIRNIEELLSVRPNKRQANGILLSIYLVGKEEGSIKEIPEEYIKHLDEMAEKEESPATLIDYTRAAIKLNNNQLAVKLANKAWEKNKLFKKQRHPIYRSIYNTILVAAPYYLSLALKNLEKGKGKKNRVCNENFRSKKLKKSTRFRNNSLDGKKVVELF